MEKARQEIEKLDTLETDQFSIIKAINLADSLACVDRRQEKAYTRCPISELRTLVSPSGVYICPYWRGKEAYKIGNVHEMSFQEMWESQRRKDVMAYTDPHLKCKFHCLRHDSNIELLRMVQAMEGSIEKVKEYDRFI